MLMVLGLMVLVVSDSKVTSTRSRARRPVSRPLDGTDTDLPLTVTSPSE
jgi:hypothetical protein